MAKAVPPQWALRFKSPLELPNVAKFSDPPQWEDAQQPVSLYFEAEDLKEDEMPAIEKDSEYYRRKRERRSSYRKKNTLVLEDSSSTDRRASTGFRFEGKMCNLGLADIEDAKSKAPKVEEAPFRYVLLQFVKNDAAQTSEVNVIPVGDMFAFKKASRIADELLTDIDERFLEEQQKSKGNISRYKGISKSLTSAERARLGLRPEEEEGDGQGRRQGLNAKEFLTGFGSASLFGAAVNKALRGGSSKRRGADADGSDDAGISRSFLNENGMDVDELRAEENQNAGDYSTRFVDDEEEYVTVEQTRNVVMADNEMNASQRYSAEVAEDGEESAGESTEDEEEQEQQARAKDLRDDEPGMVDDSMISGAAQARRLFVSKSGSNRGGAAPTVAGVSLASPGSSAALAVDGAKIADPTQFTNGAPPVKSALKRGRDEAFPAAAAGAAASGGDKASKVSFVEGGAADASSSSSSTKAAEAAAPQQLQAADAGAAASEYPLTEQGFRLFMRHRGGKVPPADMNFFKPQLKAADKAVKKRFYDIVLAITVEVEDPRLGKVLTLKQQ